MSVAERTARQERVYLLREGHLFGLVVGCVLYPWSPWAWTAWFFIVFGLWLRSLWKEYA